MKLKKYLPLILFVIGLGVVSAAAFFVLRSRAPKEAEEDTSLLRDVPLENRPIATLTPGEDGHWLYLSVRKFEIEGAASMDYELLYKLPDGRTQGVPGTIDLSGQDEIERDLLLGSESSGKFRYDEGVENGTLTLRFRNDKGQLIARFTTEFSLLSDTDELSMPDGSFSVNMDTTPRGTFFVLMETFGLPEGAPGDVTAGPYGLLASSEDLPSGEVSLDGMVYYHDGNDWQEVSDTLSPGIFIGTSQ